MSLLFLANPWLFEVVELGKSPPCKFVRFAAISVTFYAQYTSFFTQLAQIYRLEK